jgi:hypothetical protein
MAMREREVITRGERVLSEILRRYPAVVRLEDGMGPEPLVEEAGEVDDFLRFRESWRQPYRFPEDHK